MSLACWFSRHETIRDRRVVEGVAVLGFACVKCGHWEPAVARTTAERARVARIGAVRRLKVSRRPVAAHA
jgi:hypothetical protein